MIGDGMALICLFIVGLLLSIHQLWTLLFSEEDENEGNIVIAFIVCGMFCVVPFMNFVCAYWLFWERRRARKIKLERS
jgi:uncharacterized membrane protein (GlpM family)